MRRRKRATRRGKSFIRKRGRNGKGNEIEEMMMRGREQSRWREIRSRNRRREKKTRLEKEEVK